jgi:hypothetical protein
MILQEQKHKENLPYYVSCACSDGHKRYSGDNVLLQLTYHCLCLVHVPSKHCWPLPACFYQGQATSFPSRNALCIHDIVVLHETKKQVTLLFSKLRTKHMFYAQLLRPLWMNCIELFTYWTHVCTFFFCSVLACQVRMSQLWTWGCWRVHVVMWRLRWQLPYLLSHASTSGNS